MPFGDFAGTIPKGEYGAGQIEIWDRGTYEPIEWTDDTIAVAFRGDKLKGPYNLIRFPRGGKDAWIIFKRSTNSSG